MPTLKHGGGGLIICACVVVTGMSGGTICLTAEAWTTPGRKTG